jgi:hypothetical protein
MTTILKSNIFSRAAILLLFGVQLALTQNLLSDQQNDFDFDAPTNNNMFAQLIPQLLQQIQGIGLKLGYLSTNCMNKTITFIEAMQKSETWALTSRSGFPVKTFCFDFIRQITKRSCLKRLMHGANQIRAF